MFTYMLRRMGGETDTQKICRATYDICGASRKTRGAGPKKKQSKAWGHVVFSASNGHVAPQVRVDRCGAGRSIVKGHGKHYLHLSHGVKG